MCVRGDLDEAQQWLWDAHQQAVRCNVFGLPSGADIFLSVYSILQGDDAYGQQLIDEADHRLNDPVGPSWVGWKIFLHWAKAVAGCSVQQYETAEQHILEYLRNPVDRYNAPLVFLALPPVVLIQAAKGELRRAVELLALASTHPLSMKGWIQVWHPLTTLPSELTAQLGEAAYDAAWSRGKALDLHSVVSALLTEGTGGSPSSRDNDFAIPAHVLAANANLLEPLSDRELEVLLKIAEGLSNHEVAEQLFVGVSTIKKHITHIYDKLEVSSRTQALVRARELKLL
jgi:DNA-binding CsgD family transcriptional regulator